MISVLVLVTVYRLLSRKFASEHALRVNIFPYYGVTWRKVPTLMPATLPVLTLQKEFACLGLTKNSAFAGSMVKNVIKDAPILALNLLWKIADATPIRIPARAHLHIPV